MGTPVLSSTECAWFVPVHQLCSLYVERAGVSGGLAVCHRLQKGLVPDGISCGVPWETVMQPRNDEDSGVLLRREVA